MAHSILLTIRFFGQRHARLKWLRPLGPISVCIIGIIAVVAGGLQDRGIKIVGAIPAGGFGHAG
jgi:sulfate transporter 4